MTLTASKALAGTGTPFASSANAFILYVGTYTSHGSKGIYGFRFEATDGALQPLGLVAEAINPSALALVPSTAQHGVRRLLAVRETSKGTDGLGGAVFSYLIDRSSGSLKFVDQAPSHGDGPCSISLDENGRYAFVTNFWSGSVAVLPLLPDGRFGEPSAIVQDHGHSVHPQRQREPHPHDFRTMPNNRFAIASDLGIDKLLIYRFNANTGQIAPAKPAFFQTKAGSGPRHLAFSRDGRFLYVIHEIDCTVSVISVDELDGSLKLLQTVSTMDEGLSKSGDAAELFLHPNGRFLYASTRQTSTIRLFQIDGTSGKLTQVRDFSTAGQSPAVFSIAPSGKWLIAGNQNSNNLALFPVEPSTGILGKLHSSIPVNAPSSLVFVSMS